MHKVYMSEIVFLEIEVKKKLIDEMKRRKTGYKEVLNSIIKEYFKIKEIIKEGC